MKYFLSACFFFCFTTQMVFAQKCTDQIECEEGQCCRGVPPFGGICLPLSPMGAECHVIDKTVPIFGDFVIGPCPCAVGLMCVHTDEKKKNDGTCQLPPTKAPVEEPAASAEEPAEVPVEEPAEVPAKEPAASAEEPAEVPAEEPVVSAEESAAEAGDSAASDSAAAAE